MTSVSGHLSTQIIERYNQRRLSPEELLAADDHLAACVECRRLASEFVAGGKAFASLRDDLYWVARQESDHLSDEQLTAFVDDGMQAVDREIVESHLEICAMCEAEVKDLRAFREEITSARGVAGAPVVERAVPLATRARAERFAFLRAWFVNRTLLQFATAAVLLFFVATAALLLWRAAAPGSDVATVGPTPAASPLASIEPSLPQSTPTPESAEVALALNDGGRRVTMDAQGNLAGLETLPPLTQRTVKEALTTNRVETPSALKELAGKSNTLMGGSVEGVAFPLVSPVGTVVRADRPTLRWRSLGGATSYTVTILDPNFNVVSASPPSQATQWTVPRRLERGRVYSWQVTAVKDGKEVISPTAPAPEARFKVLDKEKAAELERLEASHTGSHLALGVMYAQAGLLEDAEREFRALLKENPQSPVAQKFLRSVQTQRRQK
ncbi:MAG: hypothetical protein ABJB97_00015 [Acidobacteriota bacterium]